MALWLPTNAATQPKVWLDANLASSLTISGSTVTAFTNAGGQTNGGTLNFGSVPYSATGWPGDTTKGYLDFTNAYQGFDLTNSVAYAGAQGNSVFTMTTRSGDGYPAGYFGLMGGASGSLMMRLRDDNVIDVTRSQVAGLIASTYSIAGTSAAIAASTFLSNSCFISADGNSNSNTTDPAFTGPITRICDDPTTAIGTKGKVAEIIIYDTALSLSDFQKVEGYLAWKWGYQSLLPAGHPYKSAAPTVSSGAQTVTAPLLANSQSFYAPSLQIGAVTLSPGLLSNSQTFFAPSLQIGAVTLSPGKLSNAQTFFAPTLQPGAVTLTAPLLANSQTFFGPAISIGAVTLSPGKLSNAQTFFAPTIQAGAVTLSAPLLANAQAFYAPSVSGGAITLNAPLLSNAQSFYSPTLQAGAVTLSPGLLANSQTFYAPAVTAGAQTVTAPLLANAQAFFGPALQVGAVTLSAPLLANGQTFYAPTLQANISLAAPLLSNAQAFFGPAITAGEATVSPPRLANFNVLYPAVISGGNVAATVAGVSGPSVQDLYGTTAVSETAYPVNRRTA